MTRAMIYAGGSIKGAWQIGANKACFEYGFYPDIIGGISVGSLNGTWITNEIGKYRKENPSLDPDWMEIANNLIDFWTENITKPNDIAIKRNNISLIWSIIRGKFNGASDTKPLRKLMEKAITSDYLLSSGVDLQVGAVNMADGKIFYAKPEYPDFLDYVLASSAIPFMMPVSMIGNQPFLDGGLRDSAPLTVAIKSGADEIICLANHPEDTAAAEINTGNIMELADRTMEIIVNNALNDDIKEVQLYNGLINSGYGGKEVQGKRPIKLIVIRPDVPINTKISDFDSSDIQSMINSGYHTAKRILSDM